MTAISVSFVTFEDVETCLKLAIEEFRQHDLQLLELSVDERAATHRIACYLQKYFTDWHVDCEYNRKDRDPKKINNELVRPDIIVHRRDSNKNLLCIEAKKTGGLISEIDADRKKLSEFTKLDGEYAYQFGLLLILSLQAPYNADCEWFHEEKPFKKDRLL